MSTKSKKPIKPRKPKKQDNLLHVKFPEIFKEALEELNPGIDLKLLSYGSETKVNWVCSKHTTCDKHRWSCAVKHRTYKKQPSGCPFCCLKKRCACNALIKKIDGKDNKHCSKCDTYKPIEKFNINKDKKDGRGTFCRSCSNALCFKHDSIKSAIMRLSFQGKSCAVCGEKNEICLEYDHINDNKKRKKNGRKIKNMIKMGVSDMKKEMEKCEIVCGVCHAIRTWNRTPRTLKDATQKLMRKWRLEQGKCKLCDKKITEDNHVAFHFDHIDPNTKTKCLNKMGVKQAEIERHKCQIICSNCHKIKTAKENHWKKLEDFEPEIIEKAKSYLK